MSTSMDRRSFLIGAAALGAGVPMAVAGCSSGASSSSSSGLTTITVWNRSGGLAKALQPFFKKWNETDGKKSGVRVNYVVQDTNQYEDTVRLAFRTHRAPDVFTAPQQQIAGWVAAGWLQTLDGKVGEEMLATSKPYLHPTGPLVFGSKPYALPSSTFTVRLVYNKNLFKKAGLDPSSPPQTLSQLNRAAKAISDAGHGSYHGIALPVAWVGFIPWMVDPLILATDADLADNGLFNTKTFTYQSTRYAPVIESYRRMIHDGSAYPGSATLDWDTQVANFAQGKVGMMVQYAQVAGTLRQLGSKVDTGVAQLPVPDGATRVLSPMNAGIPWALSSLAENPEKAAKVVEVLAGEKAQQALIDKGNPPIYDSVWKSAAAKKDTLLQQFRPTRSDKQWTKTPTTLLELEGATVNDTISGLILGSKDIKSTLSDLQARLQSAYEKAVQAKKLTKSDY